MLVRLGYVAMSDNLKNASPSKRMTYTQFEKLPDREAAIRKLERVAESNLHSCLRLLKHNLAHDIYFFRLSSRLIPLAGHEQLANWDYIEPLKEELLEIGQFATAHHMRIDFHPEHFIVFNSPKKEVLKQSIKSLRFHYKLLRAMGINPAHRCVLHVGGKYKDKEMALEQFIDNWTHVPAQLQRTVLLENDDKNFNVADVLYLCEKLGIPMVFDLHHELANPAEEKWENHWDRVISTWSHSYLPVKMHISSPKSKTRFREHADFINPDKFVEFLHVVSGTVSQLDCMIEAKAKDNALFRLVEDLKTFKGIEQVDGANFYVKS